MKMDRDATGAIWEKCLDAVRRRRMEAVVLPLWETEWQQWMALDNHTKGWFYERKKNLGFVLLIEFLWVCVCFFYIPL